MTDTLGRIILSIIERLSSFRGTCKNVLPLHRLVHWPLYRGVLCSEHPLSEVPLYANFIRQFKNARKHHTSGPRKSLELPELR